MSNHKLRRLRVQQPWCFILLNRSFLNEMKNIVAADMPEKEARRDASASVFCGNPIFCSSLYLTELTDCYDFWEDEAVSRSLGMIKWAGAVIWRTEFSMCSSTWINYLYHVFLFFIVTLLRVPNLSFRSIAYSDSQNASPSRDHPTRPNPTLLRAWIRKPTNQHAQCSSISCCRISL